VYLGERGHRPRMVGWGPNLGPSLVHHERPIGPGTRDSGQEDVGEKQVRHEGEVASG
jgi:hypothetical protein